MDLQVSRSAKRCSADLPKARCLKIGVVGRAGGWSSESLADRVAERTGFRLLVDMERVSARLDEGRVLFGDFDLCALDGLIIKKVGAEYNAHLLDRLEILRYVEERGVAVFSKPLSILRLLDRLSCTITLANGGIPMPPTEITEDLRHGLNAVERFGQAVVKGLYSTKARGMLLVSAEDPELQAKLTAFQAADHPVLYIQQLLKLPGRDLGIAFLGGQYLGAYARVKAGDAWNTTIQSGGHYESHEPSPQILELAGRAQALFNLDFTGVDVVETERGPMVFEVSAFGGFSGLRDGCRVDAAARYADYVVERCPVRCR
jgi:tetrahydromethanopterin:alpha-L-glutamate ligase